MFIVYAGFQTRTFPSGIQGHKDPGSRIFIHIKATKYGIFNPKTISEDVQPGSRGQKAPDPGSATLLVPIWLLTIL
jgi:hypothetical protein